MTAFIIISLIISFILICVSLYNISEHHEPGFVPIAVLVGIYLLSSLLHFVFSPTDNDVRNGKAEYVKEHHIEISNNDTVEYDLYRLDWIRNNKVCSEYRNQKNL